MGLEPVNIRAERRVHPLFHAAITFEQFGTEGGQRSPSPLFAAPLRLNDRLAEHMVQRIHKQPCTAVGHVHSPPGGRDRAGLDNPFHQLDLAVAETISRRKIDAENGFQRRQCLVHRSKTPAMEIAIGLLRTVLRQGRRLVDTTRHRAHHDDGSEVAKLCEMNTGLKQLLAGCS